MNDRALRYFLAVVRAGSVRAAADTLNVAASAVSRQIIEMEAGCGEALLERLPRGVVPTEAGRIVAEHAQRQADEAAILEDRLRRLRGVQQGTIRLQCGGGFLVDLLDNGLAGFARVHPGIAYQVSLGTTDSILDAVAQGDADIGLAYNPPARPEIVGVVTARQPLFAVLPKGHPLGHPLARAAGPVALRSFAAEPAVLLPPDHGVRKLLGRVEADEGFRLVVRMETTSFEAHRRFVRAGMGVGFLPRFAVAAELQAGTLHAVPLREVILSEATAHLVVRAGRRLPEALSRMLGWLADHLVAFRPLS
ncbi:LysR substrate-binding domain-containing protein [Methylobacterium sp. NEAU 140]|uniref:LysR family transcriptional regulator n=1 Tax=Methylobacterium sp. NEAU 140 TaxID=3064945 RepID=UPI0027354688|nr:LysR substrate-binding domain-containing protein [Methylobacterium sp. NEAU 140]MDP4021531.1 LysR substrate-binding domain-containing protein [Methylobacterium sp. NEAU 140]